MAVFGADFDLEDDEFDDDAMPEDAEGHERASKMKKFIANYERIKLIESFSTEKDEEMKRLDRPERFQGDGVDRGAMTEGEREMEAQWIAEKLENKIIQGTDDGAVMDLMMVDSTEDQEALVESIKGILSFIQIDQFECPFIWTYRRDYLHRKITRKNLWFIYMCDEKWEALMRRKVATVNEIESVIEAASTGTEHGAEVGDNEKVDESEESLEARLVEAEEVYDRQQMIASDLNLQYSAAKEKYEMAYERSQEVAESEVTGEMRAELEDLQQQFEAKQHQMDAMRAERSEIQLNVERAQEALNMFRKRHLQGSRYKTSAAREVLKQFPHELYMEVSNENLLNMA